MDKVIIAPIVAVLALVAQALFGVTIDASVQQEIVLNIGIMVTGIVSLIGVVTSYNEKRKTKLQHKLEELERLKQKL